MMKLIYTIWALLLNGMGLSVFKTCFIDALEDEYGDYLISGPPITSFIFAMGVYIIVSNLKLYPSTFRKPPHVLMGIYEFLVTAFIIEFAVACIWTPIDVHIYSTLTRLICKVFLSFQFSAGAAFLLQTKFPMAILCCATSISFFLVSLYVTRSVDFSIYSECGPAYFAKHVQNKVIRKIAHELPKLEIECGCRRSRRRSLGRKRKNC